MKNLHKNIKLWKLYAFISFFLLAPLKTTHVLGVSMGNDKKSVTKNYTSLVNSSLAGVNLIKQDGTVVKPLLDFLILFGIKHQGTVKSINDAMQKNFIRKKGLERWDLKDSEQDKKVRASALKLLRNMEFVNTISHFQVDTDYFLLFGGSLPRLEKRFKNFLDQYNAGTLQCKNIVLLGGVRVLELSEIETIKKTLGASFVNFLREISKEETELTEADAIRFLWNTKATTPLKRKFQESKNLFFVNSKNITDGSNHRPTTSTTLETWLREYIPTPGSCHANVEKPYGVRMEKNLRIALEKYSRELINVQKRFSITWNSPAASDDVTVAVYKDELARAFLQEYELKKYLGIIKN